MSSLLYLYRCRSLSGTLWVFTFSLYFDCGLVSILVCYKWTTRRIQIDQKIHHLFEMQTALSPTIQIGPKSMKKVILFTQSTLVSFPIAPLLFKYLLCYLKTYRMCVVHGFYFTFIYLCFAQINCAPLLKKKKIRCIQLKWIHGCFLPWILLTVLYVSNPDWFFYSCLQSCQLPCLCLWATLLFWPFCNGQPV